jgi:class 3 adenylate cyclase
MTDHIATLTTPSRNAAQQRSLMHPVTLRLADDVLERDFLADYGRAAVPQARIAGCLAIALYAAFGVLDAQVAPGHVRELYLIRFAVVCPLIASFVLVGFVFPGWSARVVQLAVCVIVIVAAFGLDAMPFVAPVPSDYSRTGTLLILMFLFAFARTRFVWALLTAVVVVAGYEASSVLSHMPRLLLVESNFFLVGFIVIGASTCYALERLRRREFVRQRELIQERARSDALLENVLPEAIAARLRINPARIAESVDAVSVVFADIVNFTPLSERLPPGELVALLDRIFTAFDGLCDRHGLEKIKTIGDAYMAVAGAPEPVADHAAAAAEFALDLIEVVDRFAAESDSDLQVRVGVNSGPVVAGVIGERRFSYDLWGDTVNTASRMESHGRPGAVHVSAVTHALLKDRYEFGPPETIQVKGKGSMTTYVLGVARQTPDGRGPV